MKIILWLSILSLTCGFENGSKNVEATTEEHFDEDTFLRNKYIAMDTGLKDLIEKSVTALSSGFFESNYGMNISTSCAKTLLQLYSGIRQLQPWALNFLDASGKIPDGLLTGSSKMLGNYDQCLSSTAKKKNGEISFRGRYCFIEYKPYFPDPQKSPSLQDQIGKIFVNTANVSELIRFYVLKSKAMEYTPDTLGLCVTSGCSQDDVKVFLKYASEQTSLNLVLDYCHVESDTRKLTTRNIVIICVLAFLGLLGILGSATDYYLKSNNVEFKSTLMKVLLCFAITSNFPKLISGKTPDRKLSCLHGIRVLSLFYIIYCHSFAARFMLTPFDNAFPYVYAYIPTFFYQIILNGHLSVEVFFFVGGFINIYIRMKKKEEGSSPRWWMLIIHRLWRIYPCYIFSILIAFLFTARGPYGQLLETGFTGKCGKLWWKNLLFINNFSMDDDCFLHSWYIACDMHLFLISLITIPVLMRNPKKGILLHTAVIVCGLLLTVSWVVIMKLPPAFLYVESSREDLMNIQQIYISALCHIASYFFGILLGYMMSVKKEFKLTKIHQLMGWTAASFTYLTVLFMTYRWNSGIKYTVIESVLYYPFSKPLYALAVGWMIFCCISGYGGVINYILSLKVWIPLSRLSFAIYLLSFPIQLFYVANLRSTLDTQWMITIWNYLGDLCISSLLSLAMVLLAESPMLALEKMIFSRDPSDKKNENSQDNTTIIHSVQDNNQQNILSNGYKTGYDNNITMENLK